MYIRRKLRVPTQEVCSYIVLPRDMNNPEVVGLDVEGPPEQSVIFAFKGIQVNQRPVVNFQNKFPASEIYIKFHDAKYNSKTLSFNGGIPLLTVK